MRVIQEPIKDSWPALCKRATAPMNELQPIVRDVFDAVKQDGDNAVLQYTSQFDDVALSDHKVGKEEVKKAILQVPDELKRAISIAKDNIHAFHIAQKSRGIEVETMPGVRCWQTFQAIEKVGLYIPGGTAPLFSTLLMLAVPAGIAGCKDIVMCTPPRKDGSVHPVVLYTAALCGVDNIFKVGGIQAIAAMTYGTESIPSVYKVFGPGNQYVTAAKNVATQLGLAIDLPAGPSELMVIADASANPEFIAADLLSQAEHGIDSQVILLTPSEDLIGKVKEQIDLQLQKLPRAEIATEALDHSRVIHFQDRENILDFMNTYAPEHLIINTNDNAYYSENVRNAGSVFIGPFTPESAGDYASGTNHTLPTNGYAKQYSGVTLQAFMKSITFQEIDPTGLELIGNTIETMAEAENLLGHKNAISVRLKALKNKDA